jgi:nucleotidyltransferase/DNA polymerase involved in DNA repair
MVSEDQVSVKEALTAAFQERDHVRSILNRIANKRLLLNFYSIDEYIIGHFGFG